MLSTQLILGYKSQYLLEHCLLKFIEQVEAMTRVLAISATLAAFLGCKETKQTADMQQMQVQNAYVITEHEVIDPGLPTQADDYTVKIGTDVMKVKYVDSQTTTAKPGDFPGTGLHWHRAGHDPDLSQIPQIGEAIRQCKLTRDKTDGESIIAFQPTSGPCMVQIGDTLEYAPAPNAGDFTYVRFDILSERAR